MISSRISMYDDVIGNYRILETLGKGGMGAVYLAEHMTFGWRAAVKVLLPGLRDSQDMSERFFNEATSAAAITHPGVIEIYDYGHHTDGRAYIAMEYLRGENLARRLQRLPQLGPAHALALVRQVASALGAVHSHGIVHRDLTPSNLYLVPDQALPGGERIKILDFGLSLAFREQKAAAGVALRRSSAGLVPETFGSPVYMAPELCTAATGDARSDLYSTGCILFRLLCGRAPFTAASVRGIMNQQISEPPPVPSSLGRWISPQLDALVLKLLAKDADRRYQTAAELANSIDRVQRCCALGVPHFPRRKRDRGSGVYRPPAIRAARDTQVPPAPAAAPGRRRQRRASSGLSAAQGPDLDSIIAELAPYCDIEERLGRVPENARCRGLMLRIIEIALRDHGSLPAYYERLGTCPVRALSFYSLREYLVRLAYGGALRASFECVHDGMYEISRRNALVIADSLLGRMLLRMLSPDPHRLAEQGLAAHRQLTRYSRWRLLNRGTNALEVVYANEYVWIESALEGAARGTFELMQIEPVLQTMLRDPYNGSILIQW